MKITFASKIQGDLEEIGKERRKFNRYSPAVHSLNPETRHEIIEGNELKLQDSGKVWKEVIKWVLEGKTPKMQELRGSVQEGRCNMAYNTTVHSSLELLGLKQLCQYT